MKRVSASVAIALSIAEAAFAQSNLPSTQTGSSSASPIAPPTAYSAGLPVNYVRTWQPLKPYASESDVISSSRQVSEVNHITEYMDGLGRPIQTVGWQTSPGKKDLVVPVVYDAFGREQYKYLPYVPVAADGTQNNGLLKPDPFNDQALFYNNSYKSQQKAFTNESFFYGKTEFEASPLNRIQKAMPAGNSWAGSGVGVQREYLINTAADEVRGWSIGFSSNLSSADIIPVSSNAYEAGTLYKNVQIDEAGHKVVEYVDKEGQVVLKKVQIADASSGEGHEGWLCTYYIYDDLNLLRFVIPPAAVETIRKSNVNWNLQTPARLIDELCYRYEYDKRGLMRAKKVPGTEWVYMVYDKRDRQIYSQDGALRSKGWWMATLYDNLNRPIQTAMLTGYQGSWGELETFGGGLPVDGAAGIVTVTTTGTYVGNTTQDLYVNEWQNGINYKAGNSITFQSNFTSGNSAEFTAEIVVGVSGKF